MTRKKRTIRAADLFCGAGGATEGLVQACQRLGLELDAVAINHWDLAIATQIENHPGIRHYHSKVENVSPREAVPGGKLDLLIAAPECTHHSKARGGRPINDQRRATPWCILQWIGALDDVRTVLIENVPEFRDWGPIGSNGKPLKSKKGEIYRAFISALESMGYRVEARVLMAANYGSPTTRERLFIQAQKGRSPLVWPEPTHHKTPTKSLFGTTTQKWKSAREDVIDWSIPSQSIYTRPRPLKPNTMARIYAGLHKFSGLPFILPQLSGGRPRGLDEPIPTITTTSRGIGLCQPYLVVLRNNSVGRSIDDPLPSPTTSGAHLALIEPYLVMLNGGGRLGEGGVQSLEEPLPVVTAGGNHFGVCQPFIIQTDQSGRRGCLRDVDRPVGTIVSKQNMGLVQPFMIPFFGERAGQRPRSHSVDEPLPAVTGHGAGGLITPYLVTVNHGGGDERRTHDVDGPVPAVTTKNGLGLCQPELRPFLVRFNGSHSGRRDGDRRVASVDQPLSTLDTSNRLGLCEPFLIKYNGTGGALDVDQPLDTVTARDRFGLVEPEIVPTEEIGEVIGYLDLHFRMLQPHELAAAMGFPRSYHFMGTREQTVKQIGNAIAVDVAAALCTRLLEAA